LFKGLKIEKKPTKNKNSFHVLYFNLALDLGPSLTPERVHQSLIEHVNTSISSFADTYNMNVHTSPNTLTTAFTSLAHKLKQKNLLLLVDEYDRFANKLIFNPTVYKHTLSHSQDPAHISPVRDLFEQIKQLSFHMNCRSFVTGVSPMLLNDSSGANIWTRITFDKKFGDLFGFSEGDVNKFLTERRVGKKERDNLIPILRKYLDGYRFPNSSHSYYNPVAVMRVLGNYLDDPDWLRLKIKSGEHIDEEELERKLIDESLAPTETILNALANSPVISDVLVKLLDDTDPIKVDEINEDIRIGDLQGRSASNPESRLNLLKKVASFLFYQGLATVTTGSS
jgi:hypothetical protein